jgi:hypothetical protein
MIVLEIGIAHPFSGRGPAAGGHAGTPTQTKPPPVCDDKE